MYYCYVFGGKENYNFHGWLNHMTIKKLKSEGCTVEVLDYQYHSFKEEQDNVKFVRILNSFSKQRQ